MSDGETARKNVGGRPPKYPSEGKRPTLTFRCRSSLQEKLQKSAAEGDRSVSEEVERRLDKSFADEDLKAALAEVVREETNAGVEKLVGGRDNLDLLIRLSHGIVVEQLATGKRWTDDQETRERVYRSICMSLPFILNNPPPAPGSLGDQVMAFSKRRDEVLSRVDWSDKAKQGTEK